MRPSLHRGSGGLRHGDGMERTRGERGGARGNRRVRSSRTFRRSGELRRAMSTCACQRCVCVGVRLGAVGAGRSTRGTRGRSTISVGVRCRLVRRLSASKQFPSAINKFCFNATSAQYASARTRLRLGLLKQKQPAAAPLYNCNSPPSLFLFVMLCFCHDHCMLPVAVAVSLSLFHCRCHCRLFPAPDASQGYRCPFCLAV